MYEGSRKRTVHVRRPFQAIASGEPVLTQCSSHHGRTAIFVPELAETSMTTAGKSIATHWLI